MLNLPTAQLPDKLYNMNLTTTLISIWAARDTISLAGSSSTNNLDIQMRPFSSHKGNDPNNNNVFYTSQNPLPSANRKLILLPFFYLLRYCSFRQNWHCHMCCRARYTISVNMIQGFATAFAISITRRGPWHTLFIFATPVLEPGWYHFIIIATKMIIERASQTARRARDRFRFRVGVAIRVVHSRKNTKLLNLFWQFLQSQNDSLWQLSLWQHRKRQFDAVTLPKLPDLVAQP